MSVTPQTPPHLGSMRIGRRADCDAFDPSLFLATAAHDDGVGASCRNAGERHSVSPVRRQTDLLRSDRPFRLIQHPDITVSRGVVTLGGHGHFARSANCGHRRVSRCRSRCQRGKRDGNHECCEEVP
ncbi:hypothetical protein RHA1_ro08558 (plasmid) [Rhodococcus jostii RHA1]|uniref:Uncharacterized protein n=1 Tax=Rhodococcus jostii (strain RHA1) TaxID=101510 RepID=Q0RYN4_RHOJR|nr:hypothetical protein RHA1_ro08558 [Rhodococcus jostii RHA1]